MKVIQSVVLRIKKLFKTVVIKHIIFILDYLLKLRLKIKL